MALILNTDKYAELKNNRLGKKPMVGGVQVSGERR